MNTRLMNFQVTNQSNPNGSPASSWVNVVDSFATAIANPIKAFKRAPKGFTYRIFNVIFWIQTLNVTLSNNLWAGNINIDLNLWYEHKHQLGVGKKHQRIARSRFYYTKFPQEANDPHYLRDLAEGVDGWQMTGTIDVDAVDIDIEGLQPATLMNFDIFQWRPIANWSFKGAVVSPYLYFSVSHGGVNNINKYGSGATIFGCTVEYDLVPRMKWQELPYSSN